MKRYAIYIWCFCFLLAGCGDFLEEQSQDLTYAVNCEDLEELLVGGAYAKDWAVDSRRLNASILTTASNGVYFPGIQVMDDDVEASVYGTDSGVSKKTYSLLGAFFRWAADPCNDGTNDYQDPSWMTLYTHIGVTNAVLAKVDEFTGEPEADRNRVKGQALFLRAYYYYYLVNMYAKPYSAITADSDPGVPLKTFAHIDDRYWGRASVDSVYHQIVRDLKGAIDCLAGMPVRNCFWAGEDAARTLLGRVYCYMGKWDLVPEVCDKLVDKYFLADIATDSKEPYIARTSPELIFTMGQDIRKAIFEYGSDDGKTISTFRVSRELRELYGEGDRRPDVRFTLYRSEIYPKEMEQYVSNVFTLRLSEVYLNLAEAYAMTNNEGRARELLQELREKRIAAGNVGTLTESGEKLIQAIREERRRELCFEGQRWFDLRRYAVCPNYPGSKDIRHEHYTHTTGTISDKGDYAGYYLLIAYPSKNWVLPIPPFEIEENQGELEKNERSESILY